MKIANDVLHPVAGNPESGAICRFHAKEGYSRFRSVFSTSEIAALRAAVERAFAEAPSQTENKPRFLVAAKDAPELTCVVRHPGVVRSLSTILGDDYLHCDEFGVHADFYSSGWHCDTSSPSNAGHDFFWDPNFNVVQVAIYLQSNDIENGGGLDVIPGSHMHDDPFCIQRTWLLPHEPPPPALDTRFSARVARRLHRYAVTARSRGLPIPGVRPDNRTQALSRAETVISDAGDLLAFNLRLGHRSTPAHPGARGKRGLFFVCGANNRATRAYGDWIDRYHDETRRKPCARDEYIAGFKPAGRPEPLPPRGDEGSNG